MGTGVSDNLAPDESFVTINNRAKNIDADTGAIHLGKIETSPKDKIKSQMDPSLIAKVG